MRGIAERAGHWLYSQPYLLLTITATTWGGNIIIGRLAAGHIPPIALAQLRWFGALAVLLPLFWSHLKADLPAIRRGLPVLLLLSFFGITVFNSMAYFGLQYTQAINGALMQSTAPFWIALWSLVLFRDRLAPGQIGGILLSFLGVLAILSGGQIETLLSLTLNPGDLFMIGAIASYSIYAALLRRRPPIHPLSLLVFTIGAGGLMLLPATLLEVASGYTMTFDALTLSSLLYVILFATITAYICFNRGVELIGPNRAGPFFHLVPVVASLLAIAFLGEVFRWHHAVGYSLILVGIALAQRRRKPI